MATQDDTKALAKPLRPDDTPPRNGVIFTYTVLAVLTLIGLKYVFDSYMDVSRRDQRRENIERSRTSLELAEYRVAQAEQLGGGAMPIDRAMAELARRGRGAFPLIRPTASDDRDPLRGWTQLPRDVPEPPANTPVPEEGVLPPPTGVLPQGTVPGADTLPGTPPEPGAGAPAEGVAPAGEAPAEAVEAPAPARAPRRRAAAPAAEAPAAPAAEAPGAE